MYFQEMGLGGWLRMSVPGSFQGPRDDSESSSLITPLSVYF